MIQVLTIRPTLIQTLPATRVESRGVGVRHLRGHAGTRSMIRGVLDDATAPAIGAVIVGRLLGVKPTPGLGTLSVITAAAGLVDVTVSGREARRRRGHDRQRAGAVHPPDGIGGMILDGGETDWIV